MENTTDKILRQCIVDKRFANVQTRLLPNRRLDSTRIRLDTARHDTPLTLRHSCQLFRTTFFCILSGKIF